jgi:hypothetical protein
MNAFDGMLFSNDGARFLKDAKCRNTALMNAIRSLTWTVPEAGRAQRYHGRQRISYADLSVEEIGAIYEELLDYAPRVTTGFDTVNGQERRPGEFVLDPEGSERKTTGSYYTNPDLIAELIKSALDPVLKDRLSRAGPDPAARERALLSIRVCDPACGSGAFLIAASNRLGRELAKIRRDGASFGSGGAGGPAGRALPLHLRGRPEPDGGGAREGLPLDQRAGGR